MQNFKSHIKTVGRRVTFLQKKAEGGKINSWDKSELSSLQALIRSATAYNDARGEGESHIENVLYMVRDVLTEVKDENSDVLEPDARERLEYARNKCTDAIEFIHRMDDYEE